MEQVGFKEVINPPSWQKLLLKGGLKVIACGFGINYLACSSK
jgi:hypothetical protein